MRKLFLAVAIVFFGLLHSSDIKAQSLSDTIQSFLDSVQRETGSESFYRMRNLSIDDSLKTVYLTLSDNFSRILFTEEFVEDFKCEFMRFLSPEAQDYTFKVFSNSDNIEQLVPNIYRRDLPKDKSRLSPRNTHREKPLVRNQSQELSFEQGLSGRNIAIWNSHGYFYNQRNSRWEWQRGRLLTTVEDKFTTQIIINYLMPMLENSGAYVFLPRERDPQTQLFICDNDSAWNFPLSAGSYREFGDEDDFLKDSLIGFADTKPTYIEHENPFLQGTARKIRTHRKATSGVEFLPQLTQSGWYSVSVAYRSLEKSATDAHYRVYHSAGETDFRVNQAIGGGTWIYLGTFHFDHTQPDSTRRVVLYNDSKNSGKVVVADAVKFGGGMGNIARRPADKSTIEAIPDPERRKNSKLLSKNSQSPYTTSGVAKFWEGSRYYLQWAGFPYDIYSHTWGINDYTDDYASRGKWVSMLNSGSSQCPDSLGLGVPMDLSLALHSDAGIDTQKVVGTLGIVTMLSEGSSLFPNRQSRYASYDMANIILSEMKRDISQTFRKDWSIRGVNNANYAESRMPNVPSMILECLSHQNLLDLSYGLNPKFQFTMARSIYKGIAKFLAFQNSEECTIQPLAVNSFSALLEKNSSNEDTKPHKHSVRLSWQATSDDLEPTAEPGSYIIYTRRMPLGKPQEQGWDNGFVVYEPQAIIPISEDTIYSFKVVAMNDGGMSFPSEVLSVCYPKNAKGEVLVVNGFTKTSAAKCIDESNYKGFLPDEEQAIPYINDYSYTGTQYEFSLHKPFQSNYAPGFGASNGDYEMLFIKGNTFDYPLTHGMALSELGYAFSSSSMKSVEQCNIDIMPYDMIDIILGKQYRKLNDFSGKMEFKTIPLLMQNQINSYLDLGGKLFMSGSYFAKDLIDCGTESDRDFAENTLGITWQDSLSLRDFYLSGVHSKAADLSGINNLFITSEPNDSIYPVDRAEVILPYSEESQTILKANHRLKVGVASKLRGKVVAIGVPFEAIPNHTNRKNLMLRVLRFLMSKK